METKSYAVDAQNKKIYKNDFVLFSQKKYKVLDFQYLQRSYDVQYLRLEEVGNPRKVLDFVDSAFTLKTENNFEKR